MTTATRTDLVSRLLELPPILRAFEEDLLTATLRLTEAKRALEDREAMLTVTPSFLEGAKNQGEREARLLLACREQREAVQQATETRDRCALELRVTQAEFSALRACTRVIGWDEGGDDDA